MTASVAPEIAAQPARPGRWLTYLGWGALAALIAAQALGFLTSVPDRDMGHLQKIMYVHVPAAWNAFIAFFVVFVASALYLWKGEERHDLLAASAAEVGAVLTGLTLALGSIWGRPTWGVWWTWDARLTSMLVLLLLYLGLLALRSAIEDPNQAGRAAAVLSLVGFVNVPIVKFSVDWWNTLHQPASVFRMDGPTIHPSLLWPLLICAIGFTLLMLALHMAAMRTEIYRRRLRVMEARAAAEAAFA